MRYSEDELLAILPRLLRFDADTGRLYWRPRSGLSWWNTRYADQEAFVTPDSGGGYLEGRLFGRKYLAHRVVWALVHGAWPIGQIDHINHDRSDNRPANLRCVDAVGNGRNRSLSTNSTTGVTGVCWVASRSRWLALIQVRGKRVHLGWHATFEGAVAARKAGERKYDFHPNHGAVAA